ncbi:MAG TPA: elongation factor P [Armatimonadota bacterium]|nr:elongation factor P [Armatimonadota bacterium]
MITPNDFKPGLTIELDGRVLQVVSSDHHKQSRGQAIVRSRLRDLKTGELFSKTFRSNESIETARVDRTQCQFLYAQGEDTFVFMNMDDYDQREFTREQIGDRVKWLKEGDTVIVATYEGDFVDLDVPKTVDRRVVHTDPGLRGDTAQGGTKPATIEGGAVVQVPLFVSQGDVIRVETASGQYVTRV